MNGFFLRPALVLLAVLAMAPLSCTRRSGTGEEPAGGPASAEPRAGGTLRIPIGAEPAGMNPLLGRRGRALDLWGYFYPSLLAYESQGAKLPAVRGDLARRWSWSAETKILTVVLRADRFWEDTTRVRAVDVLCTYEAYKAMGRIPGAAPGDSMPDPGLLSVEAVDDSTLRLKYQDGFTFWRALPAAAWPVLPASKIGNRDPQMLLASPLSREPLSAGPFRLLDWRPGLNLWMGPSRLAPSGRVPYLRKIAFERCPAVDARILRLVLGEADVVRDAPVSLLSSLLEPSSDVQVHRSGVASVEMIFWNQHALFPSSLPQAVSLAIDRERMITTLLTFRGERFGGIAGGLLEPTGPLGADSLLKDSPMPRFDRAAADSLLDALGYAERGGDGIRVRAGLPLSVEILYDRSNEFRERVIALLEEDLTRVGIRLDPIPLEGAAVWQRFRAGIFQTALIGFRPPGLPDLSSLWASWGRWNGAGYASSRADSLIKAILSSESGAEVERLGRALEAEVRRNGPATFVISRDAVDLLSPRVRDFSGTQGRPYGDLEKTWLADTTGKENVAVTVTEGRRAPSPAISR